MEKQCQGEGFTLATRDDGEPICYYYIDDVESDGDKYLDYYQSKARCEQRGKKFGRTTRVCTLFLLAGYEIKNVKCQGGKKNLL